MTVKLAAAHPASCKLRGGSVAAWYNGCMPDPGYWLCTFLAVHILASRPSHGQLSHCCWYSQPARLSVTAAACTGQVPRCAAVARRTSLVLFLVPAGELLAPPLAAPPPPALPPFFFAAATCKVATQRAEGGSGLQPCCEVVRLAAKQAQLQALQTLDDKQQGDGQHVTNSARIRQMQHTARAQHWQDAACPAPGCCP